MAFLSSKKSGIRLKKADLQKKTFDELGREYIDYLQSNKRSICTIKSYEDKIRKFNKYLGEDIDLKDIDNILLDKYKRYLLKTNMTTSVNSHFTHLKTLFNYANQKGYMNKITISKLEGQEKVKHVYTKEVLAEWLENRQYKSPTDGLFCNSYGEPLKQATLRTLIYRYFKKKDIRFEGIHQFRRTIITHSVANGINIIKLSKITGIVTSKL